MVTLVVEGRGCPAAAAQPSLAGLLGAKLGGLAWAAYALVTRAIGQADVAALFLSRKILLSDFPMVRTRNPSSWRSFSWQDSSAATANRGATAC